MLTELIACRDVMSMSAAYVNLDMDVVLAPTLVVRVKLRLRSWTGSLLPRMGTGQGPRFAYSTLSKLTHAPRPSQLPHAQHPSIHALGKPLSSPCINFAMISKRQPSSWLPTVALLSFLTCLAAALSGQEPMKSVEEARGYNPGEIIPVSCLNRTMYVSTYE